MIYYLTCSLELFRNLFVTPTEFYRDFPTAIVFQPYGYVILGKKDLVVEPCSHTR